MQNASAIPAQTLAVDLLIQRRSLQDRIEFRLSGAAVLSVMLRQQFKYLTVDGLEGSAVFESSCQELVKSTQLNLSHKDLYEQGRLLAEQYLMLLLSGTYTEIRTLCYPYKTNDVDYRSLITESFRRTFFSPENAPVMEKFNALMELTGRQPISLDDDFFANEGFMEVSRRLRSMMNRKSWNGEEIFWRTVSDVKEMLHQKKTVHRSKIRNRLKEVENSSLDVLKQVPGLRGLV